MMATVVKVRTLLVLRCQNVHVRSTHATVITIFLVLAVEWAPVATTRATFCVVLFLKTRLAFPLPIICSSLNVTGDADTNAHSYAIRSAQSFAIHNPDTNATIRDAYSPPRISRTQPYY